MRGSKVAQRVVVFAVVMLGASMAAGGFAAAQQADCADVTVNPGQDLVTRGVSTIGPIQINVPAGTYRIVMVSTDVGHAPGHQEDQQNERWSFTLDSGYSSPITPDLATEVTTATFDMVSI